MAEVHQEWKVRECGKTMVFLFYADSIVVRIPLPEPYSSTFRLLWRLVFFCRFFRVMSALDCSALVSRCY